MAEDDANAPKSKKKPSAFKRLFSFARDDDDADKKKPAEDWIAATNNIGVGLDDMLAGDAADMPDNLHIISLKALRGALGEFDWQRRYARICGIAESLIERNLPRGASFRRFGEDAFVLAFPRQTDEQAGAITLTIADEMGYRLIGEQFRSDPSVRIGIAKADTQLLVSDGGLDTGAVDLALKSTIPVETDFETPRPELGEDEGPELPPNDVIPEDEEGPGMNLGDLGDGKRKPGKDPKWGKLKHEGQTADGTLVANNASRPDSDDPQWSADETDPREKKPESDWIGLGIDAGASPLAVGLPEDLFAIVYPTWSEVSGRIDLHVVAPAVRRDGHVISGAVVMGRNPGLQALAVADRLMVEAAARLLGGGDRAPGAVIVPIHWETMNEARFPTLTPAFGRIEDTARKAKLLVELTRVPEGVDRDRLRAAVQRLKTMCRAVLVRDGLGQGRHELFRKAGAAAVGADLADESMFHDALPHVLADEMANRGGVAGYLWGIRRKGDLLAAVEAGFRFLAGPALRPAALKPSKAIVLPKDKMIAALDKYRRGGSQDEDPVGDLDGL